MTDNNINLPTLLHNSTRRTSQDSAFPINFDLDADSWLLPIPHSLGSPTDRLCTTCASFNFTPERFVVFPGDKETGKPITLGLVKDIRQRRNCPFCRLVLASLGGSDVPESENGEPVSILMNWNTSERPPPPGMDASPRKIRNLLPYARTQRGPRNVRPKMFYAVPQITLLANDAATPSKTLFPRLIREDQIDFAMVRRWISMCGQWHGSSCNTSEYFAYESENPAEQIPSFRLIDVEDKCIVHAPKDAKYITLSYVWGQANVVKTLKSNTHLLEQPGSLETPEFRDKLPMTISDAMQVVRELDLRYLWVDSLCIIQDDDTGSKMAAIQKMDLVYSACFLTIIATGKDANAGLPGVWPDTRGQRQLVEELRPGFRLSLQSPTHNFMQDSVYFTRAWTFQERQFAPRNLMFIDGQVVFSCGQAQWRECELEDKTTLYRPPIPIAVDLGTFWGLVQTYSSLSLTYDSDIHNAFAGVARYFQARMGINLCHGIPDKYFDWCLLWTPHTRQERRNSVPSWSWAGWRGQSWNRLGSWMVRDDRKIIEAMEKRTWIVWYQRVAHDSAECTLLRTPEPTPLAFVKSQFAIDCTKTLPTPTLLKDAAAYYSDIRGNGSGFLQFWTVSIMLNIGEPSSRAPRIGPESRLPLARIGLFGRGERELGVLYVSEKWWNAVDHGRCELLLLCEGRDREADRGKEDDEDGWKYMIMLIEWHGAWAERISLGSIQKGDLLEALEPGPQWKEIILG